MRAARRTASKKIDEGLSFHLVLKTNLLPYFFHTPFFRTALLLIEQLE